MVKCSRCRKWVPDTDVVTRSLRPVCITCAEAAEARRSGSRTVYNPTHEQIAANCKEILADETDEQLRIRAGYTLPFAIKEVRISSPDTY